VSFLKKARLWAVGIAAASVPQTECVSLRQDSYDSKHQRTKQTSFAFINSTSSSDEPSSVNMILAFTILSRMLGGSSVASKLATEWKVKDTVRCDDL
jgi:hypothetical protein